MTNLFVDQTYDGYANFQQMLNMKVTNAARRGEQVHPNLKQQLKVVKESCKDQSPQQFNQDVRKILDEARIS